jgi:RnlB antitoxin of RnlAB toxin-antitoxin system
MSHYRLQALQHHAFAYVSLSLSAVGLDHYYDDIQCDLHSEIKGRILFDQLLSHGMKERRFISMYFDGEQFDISSYQVEEYITPEVEKLCSSFYLSNPEMLSCSVLTKPQQFLFKKGMLHAS